MTDEFVRRVQAIAANDALRGVLWLVSKGIPFDVAFSLGDDERVAWSIILGELTGGTFDWQSFCWRSPE